MDKLTLIRSMDCRASDHTPITMQAGHSARRTNDGKDGGGYPSMGSITAKFRGSNHPQMPAFIGLADSWVADVWGSGHMGSEFAPFKGGELNGRLALPKNIGPSDLHDRDSLRLQFDRLQRELDVSDGMDRMDHYSRQALEMVVSGKAQKAFQIHEESDRLRDAYGRDSLGEKALLARGSWKRA